MSQNIESGPPVPDRRKVHDVRADYFRKVGFTGVYDDTFWVRVPVGRFAIYFPNIKERQRSIKCHDLHHIVTGYDTDWRGEGESAAWELGAGCGNHYFAWLINFPAVLVGLCMAPKRTWRAYLRGLHRDCLYSSDLDTDPLEMTVSELRAALRVPQCGECGPPPAREAYSQRRTSCV